MKTGTERILAERQRQIEAEGWTHEHDDEEHANGELLIAADSYERAGNEIAWGGGLSRGLPPNWPWEWEWWKPSLNPLRNYEKAGALFMAEAERLYRAGNFEGGEIQVANWNRVAGKMDKIINAAAFEEAGVATPRNLTINEIAERQHAWLVKVGWVGKTSPLEDLALITSEIGEAANECRGEEPSDEFATELADIVLRTLGLARKEGIDIGAAITAKMELNAERGTRGRIK